MRRDKNDEKWQAAKQRCFELDKNQCLLCQCLTVKEALLFEQNQDGFSTSKIDPAHYKPVSLRPDLIYDADNNIYSLCRRMHERLDHGRDPVTGEYCTPDATEKYWQRIIAKRKENLSKTDNVDLPEFFYNGETETNIKKDTTDHFDGFFYEEL